MSKKIGEITLKDKNTKLKKSDNTPVKATTKEVKINTGTKKENLNFFVGRKGKRWSWSIKFGISVFTIATLVGILLLQTGIYGKGRLGKTLQLAMLSLGDQSTQIANKVNSDTQNSSLQSEANDLASLSDSINNLSVNDVKKLNSNQQAVFSNLLIDYQNLTGILSEQLQLYPNLNTDVVLGLINLAEKIKINNDFLLSSGIKTDISEELLDLPASLLDKLNNQVDSDNNESNTSSVTTKVEEILKAFKNKDNVFLQNNSSVDAFSILENLQGNKLISYEIVKVNDNKDYYQVVVSFVFENKEITQTMYLTFKDSNYYLSSIES